MHSYEIWKAKILEIQEEMDTPTIVAEKLAHLSQKLIDKE